MTFRDLHDPKTYGFDLQGFAAWSGGKRYNALCPACLSPIEEFARDPMNEYPDHVSCSKGHYTHYDNILLSNNQEELF